jgi:hypothetical protein
MTPRIAPFCARFVPVRCAVPVHGGRARQPPPQVPSSDGAVAGCGHAPDLRDRQGNGMIRCQGARFKSRTPGSAVGGHTDRRIDEEVQVTGLRGQRVLSRSPQPDQVRAGPLSVGTGSLGLVSPWSRARAVTTSTTGHCPDRVPRQIDPQDRRRPAYQRVPASGRIERRRVGPGSRLRWH